MNWSKRYATSTKEVKQHIKALKDRGWDYLGVTGSGHHKMQWPHAPQKEGVLRFSATPSDPQWLPNSQKDAQTIEKKFPAPIQTTQNTPRAPSTWDIRLQIDQAVADAESRARDEESNRPLTVQEKMRLKRQLLYKERGI